MEPTVIPRPRRYLIRMILFIIAVLLLIGFLYDPIESAFLANAPLNGLICGVLILGITYNIRQVILLYPETDWIDSFRLGRPKSGRSPRLLAPMASMVGVESERLRLSAMSMRTVLDGIASRLDESRDISRYTIGLLIFLGLLGTFWGLLDTVGSIRGVINQLSVSGTDITQVFSDLKAGLQSPLIGMDTAFSSSLLGLSGSLILGFLDLQAGQAQNRFFNNLEEWLSSITRLSSGSLSGEGEQPVPVYVQALLEQTADSLENLQRTLTRSEESRISVNASLQQMNEQMSILTEHMRTEHVLMKSMSESQVKLNDSLKKIADNTKESRDVNFDDSTKAHIRNLDIQMGRVVEELGNGRAEILQQFRSEIKLLARTIAAITEGQN